MSELKKYDLEQGGGYDAGGAMLVETADGDWVKYEDVAPLLEQLKAEQGPTSAELAAQDIDLRTKYEALVLELAEANKTIKDIREPPIVMTMATTELKDQLARYETVLRKLARLGNGDSLGNSNGNTIAINALRNEGVEP